MTRGQIEQAFADAKVALAEDANIAESRVLYYDTLVLKKGTDYDSSGKLTKNFSDGRAKAWTGRARREGSEAATRRDDVRKAIDDRKRQDRELELRIEREEQERIASYEEFQRRIQPPDRANDGGVDPPLVAAMQLEDETEPVRDPHGGRASLVRAMVNRIRGASKGSRRHRSPPIPTRGSWSCTCWRRRESGPKRVCPLMANTRRNLPETRSRALPKGRSSSQADRGSEPEESREPKRPGQIREQPEALRLPYRQGDLRLIPS